MRPLALLLVAAVASGCLSSAARDADATPDEPPAAAGGGADRGAEDAPGAAPSTESEERYLPATASVGSPLGRLNFVNARVAELSPGPNVTGYVVELEWTPSSPASARLGMWAQGDDGRFAAADGPSPLRLVLPRDALPKGGVLVFAHAPEDAPLGVAVDQVFTVHVTTFRDLPFDPDFSAAQA